MLIILALFINSNSMKNAAKTTKTNPLSVASKQEAQKVELINPKREPITPKILKRFPGYEDLSEEQLIEHCEAIKTFARLLLAHLASVENTIPIDNQHVIPLDCHQDDKVVPLNNENKKPKVA
jgi:hypothetical protein